MVGARITRDGREAITWKRFLEAGPEVYLKRDEKDKEDQNVLYPVHDLYLTELDYCTDHIHDKSCVYDCKVTKNCVKHFPKWASLLQVQLKSQQVDTTGFMLFNCFLSAFKMACDKKDIHVDEVRWIVSNFIKWTAAAKLTERLSLKRSFQRNGTENAYFRGKFRFELLSQDKRHRRCICSGGWQPVVFYATDKSKASVARRCTWDG